MSANILEVKSTAKQKNASVGKNTQSNMIENRRLLLHMIFESKEISRKELAAKSGLTAAAVTIITGNFIEEGLVEECGLKDIGGARKVRMLRMNNIFGVISVRLHRTYFSIGFYDIRLQKLYKNRVYCNIDGKQETIRKYLEQEIDGIKKLAEKAELKILGIMLGVNDLFHVEERGSQSPDAYGKEYDSLKKTLQENTGLTVEINRNCNLCSYQLWKSVWKKQNGTVIAMLVSYSIECGVVINGEVMDGYQGRSGMIGGMRYEKNDDGSWTTFNDVASTSRLLKCAAELMEEYPESCLCKKEDFSIHDLTDAYVQGDPLGKRVYEEVKEYYAEALARVANVLSPDLFFIGGSIPLVKEYQLEIFEEVARILMKNEEEIIADDNTETGIITLNMPGKGSVLRFVSPEIEGTANDPVFGGLEYIVDIGIETGHL